MLNISRYITVNDFQCTAKVLVYYFNVHNDTVMLPPVHTHSFQGDDRYTLLTNSVTLRTAYRTGSAANRVIRVGSWIARGTR